MICPHWRDGDCITVEYCEARSIGGCSLAYGELPDRCMVAEGEDDHIRL